MEEESLSILSLEAQNKMHGSQILRRRLRISLYSLRIADYHSLDPQLEINSPPWHRSSLSLCPCVFLSFISHRSCGRLHGFRVHLAQQHYYHSGESKKWIKPMWYMAGYMMIKIWALLNHLTDPAAFFSFPCRSVSSYNFTILLV